MKPFSAEITDESLKNVNYKFENIVFCHFAATESKNWVQICQISFLLLLLFSILTITVQFEKLTSEIFGRI
jgi:hypothetical protein